MNYLFKLIIFKTLFYTINHQWIISDPLGEDYRLAFNSNWPCTSL